MLNPDSSIKSSVKSIRQKPQFMNLVSFSLNCINQSLAISNSKYQDNARYLINQKFYQDVVQILYRCDDQNTILQSITILLKMMAIDEQLVAISLIIADSFIKQLNKNLCTMSVNTEIFLNLFVKLNKNPIWKKQIHEFLSRVISQLELNDEDILKVLNFVEKEQLTKIDKIHLFNAVKRYKNIQIVKILLNHLYNSLNQKIVLTNTEIIDILQIAKYFNYNVTIGYLCYHILSFYYKYSQITKKLEKKQFKNILTYIYTLAEQNISFSPNIIDQLSFIENLMIIEEGGTFKAFAQELFFKKFNYITTDAAQITFISIIKKNCLKQNLKHFYSSVKAISEKSQNKKVAGQYQYILKYFSSDHALSKNLSFNFLSEQNFKNSNSFDEYFIHILQMTWIFKISYNQQETEKFLTLCSKFCTTKSKIKDYLTLFFNIVEYFYQKNSKSIILQQLMIKFYQVLLYYRQDDKKIHLLQKFIYKSTLHNVKQIVSQKKSFFYPSIPLLIQNSQYFKFIVENLNILENYLLNQKNSTELKFQMILKLYQNHNDHTNILKIIKFFLDLICRELQSQNQSSKLVYLKCINYHLKKLKKVGLFMAISKNENILFSLEKLFYLLINSLRIMQSDDLLDILFELEKWINLREYLNKYQAQKILISYLSTYTKYTSDILELLVIQLENADKTLIQKIEKSKFFEHLKKNFNKFTLDDIEVLKNLFEYLDQNKLVRSYNENEVKVYMDLNKKYSIQNIEIVTQQLKYISFFSRDILDITQLAKVQSMILKQILALGVQNLIKNGNFVQYQNSIKTVLVTILNIFKDEDQNLPNEFIQSLNMLLISQYSNIFIVKKCLQIISICSHTFNLTKIKYKYLYEKFINNREILQLLNDLLEMIVNSSEKVINSMKLQKIIENIIYSIVYENDNDLIRQKIRFLEITCFNQSNYSQLLASKNFIFEKVIENEITNFQFYRPFIIEFALNTLIDLNHINVSSVYKLGKVLEKFIDQLEISYIIVNKLKEFPKEIITQTIKQQNLIYLIMNHQDKQLKDNCKELLKYYTISNSYQNQFIKEFSKQEFEKCEKLIEFIESPHELILDKQDLNKFLYYHSKNNQQSKIKDFITRNRSIHLTCFQCQNMYRHEIYFEEILKEVQEKDQDYQNLVFQKQIILFEKYENCVINEKMICSGVIKQKLIESIMSSLIKNKNYNQIPKLKMICLYSRFQPLRKIIKNLLKPQILSQKIYIPQLLNLNLNLFFGEQLKGNFEFEYLIHHLRIHFQQYQESKKKYYNSVIDVIFHSLGTQLKYHLRLLEIIIENNQDYNNQCLFVLAQKIIKKIDQNNKSFKFANQKQQNYFKSLELINYRYVYNAPDILEQKIFSFKLFERLFNNCTTTFHFDIFFNIFYAFLNQQKDNNYDINHLSKFNFREKLEKYSNYANTILNLIFNQLDFKEKSKQIQKKAQQEKQLQKKTLQTHRQKVSQIQKQQEQIKKQSIIKQKPAVQKSSTQYKMQLKSNLKPEKDALRQQAKYLENILDKQLTEKDLAFLNSLHDKILSICDQNFFYKKIIKLNIIDKLILISTKTNTSEIIQILVKISHNKNKQLLKQQYIIGYFKKELKKVLEAKKNSYTVNQILIIIRNSQDQLLDLYFKQGIFSMLLEILKSYIMVLQILQFLNHIKFNQKIMNQIYQRGIIAMQINSIKNPKTNPDELAQWISLIGKIAINSSIQNKLISSDIHNFIFNVFQNQKDKQKICIACANAFAYLAINNEDFINWIIQKKLTQSFLSLISFTKNYQIKLFTYLYCVSYNNEKSKRHLRKIGALIYLIKAFKIQNSAAFPDSQYLCENLKTLSTLSVLKQNSEILIKQKLCLELLSNLDKCMNKDYLIFVTELLSNVTRNIQTQKEFSQIRSQKIWQILKLIENDFQNKQNYENFIIILFNIYRYDLNSKDLTIKLLERILEIVLSKQLSEQSIKMVLKIYVDINVKRKNFEITQNFISNLEKIMLKRTSDLFFKEFLDILAKISNLETVKILKKYKLVHILCDQFQVLIHKQELKVLNLQILQFLSKDQQLSKLILEKIGTSLLDKTLLGIFSLKIISNISKYNDNVGMLLQIKTINILMKDFIKNSVTQNQIILNIIKNLMRQKPLQNEEKQICLTTLKNYQQPTLAASLKEVLFLLNQQSNQINQQIKMYMQKGVNCKLYKNDGSLSQLLVIVSRSFNQINCVESLTQPVKPKWRMPINELKQINTYPSQSEFKKSNFEKSSFLGKKPQKQRCLSLYSKNNEFHMCFKSKQQKQKWVTNLQMIENHVSKMLTLMK